MHKYHHCRSCCSELHVSDFNIKTIIMVSRQKEFALIAVKVTLEGNVNHANGSSCSSHTHTVLVWIMSWTCSSWDSLWLMNVAALKPVQWSSEKGDQHHFVFFSYLSKSCNRRNTLEPSNLVNYDKHWSFRNIFISTSAFTRTRQNGSVLKRLRRDWLTLMWLPVVFTSITWLVFTRDVKLQCRNPPETDFIEDLWCGGSVLKTAANSNAYFCADFTCY